MKFLHIIQDLKKYLLLLLLSFSIFIVTIIATPAALQAQKLVRDSIVVSFQNPLPIQSPEISIDSIRDIRNESPRTVGKYEVSKFLVIPVDLDIRTEKPLSQEILAANNTSSYQSSLPQISLLIDEFNLSKNSGSWLFPRYFLNAAFRVYWHRPDSTRFIGEILYEVPRRPAIFGDNLKNGFQKVIYQWQQEFITDLNTISVSLTNDNTPRLENLHMKAYTGKFINLYSGISYIRYPDSHIMDWEMFFSSREARRWFIRTGGYQIRFRNADDFESFSFGLSRDYLFHRLSHTFLFKIKSQLMMGINRWKDIQTVNHEIYDALIFEYVLGQDIVYNVLDKRSMLLGIGVQENVFYIYSKNWKFKIGLSIYLGVKL